MANTKAVGVAFADPAFESVQVGTSGAPIAITSAGVLNGAYATTSASSGDTRLSYNKLTFTGTGSGETLRAFSVVTGAGAAAAGTINGAHISMSVTGNGTISGAANALRATLGVGASVTPGGTIAAIQADSDIGAGATLPGNAAFIRVTNSGSGTVANLMNLPAAMIQAKVVADSSHLIKIIGDNGTAYYLMATTTAP